MKNRILTERLVAKHTPMRIGLQYFGMKNLDAKLEEKNKILAKINAAVKSGDETAFSAAFSEFTDLLQESVMEEARGIIKAADNTILAGRGVRALTSEETKFYQSFIEASRSNTPKQALAGTEYVVPKTVIDAVFEDMIEAHPILDAINFQNTGALTEILISATSGTGVWGELTAAITGELGATFSKIDLAKKKFTAYILIAKSMLDLGPEWIDRYVRALLVEANATGLELGAVDGDGDEKPLGMTRALTGAVDGIYPRKTPVVITDLSQLTYGTILNTLSQGPNSKRRVITEVLMVVNPADYFLKVMPASTVRNTDGGFNYNVFPFPTRVCQSAAQPVGYATFGIAKRYFMGLGTSKGGKIEYDDSVKFFEDQRAYAVKLYGDGKALDANAFVYCDIRGLIPYIQKVYITNTSLDANITNDPLNVLINEDARLASLILGTIDLVPAFNKSVHVYTAATTDATNTISAIAKDGEATIAIVNGATPVTNGAAATWAEGANVVTIEVTNGAETEEYTVTVTKS